VIYHGDLFDVLPTLQAQSVHCVVTSPPYWGLRDYGVPGQLGLEPTPEAFVARMVEAFAEVHRVLRDDGTCWLNIGDCYASDSKGDGGPSPKQLSNVGSRFSRRKFDHGLKQKDLVGVPWMLAFALRSWGWYLRAEIIWAKGVSFCDAYAGSVMPESVTDRPTRSHEQVFLLTKQKSYFYDAEAVRERGVYPAGTMAAKGSGEREGNRRGTRKKDEDGGRVGASGRTQTGSFQDRWDKSHQKNAQREDGNHPWDGYSCYDGTRNLRTVWTISPKPFAEAHFATFPSDLVVPCIKAGTSEKGVCAVCGAPWKRIVEKEPIPDDVRADFAAARQRSAEDHGRDDGFTTRRPNFQRGRGATTWERTCEHVDADVVPAVVMDCFSGAGTVGAVCAGLHRRYVGIELNPEYIAIAERRIAAVAPLFAVDGPSVEGAEASEPSSVLRLSVPTEITDGSGEAAETRAVGPEPLDLQRCVSCGTMKHIPTGTVCARCQDTGVQRGLFGRMASGQTI
jgi:DNA modification methylase